MGRNWSEEEELKKETGKREMKTKEWFKKLKRMNVDKMLDGRCTNHVSL